MQPGAGFRGVVNAVRPKPQEHLDGQLLGASRIARYPRDQPRDAAVLLVEDGLEIKFFQNRSRLAPRLPARSQQYNAAAARFVTGIRPNRGIMRGGGVAMIARSVLFVLITSALCAQVKKPLTATNSDDAVEIRAVAYIEKEAIREAVGADLDPGIVVFEVHLRPQVDRKITVNRDDFLLRSDKDGQRSTPYAPAQIAGSSVLVVSTVSGRAAIAGEDRGPVWGGVGGTRPQRAGTDGASLGNSGSTQSAKATVLAGEKDKAGKPNTTLDLLTRKALPEGETADTRSGLLYFMLEGKHKPKDLELIYRSPLGRISMRFK
jgi:hypothetical protein